MDAASVVIADIGDALFASSDLVIEQQTEFLSPAYYCSMGFAVPAALGRDGRAARTAADRAGGRRRVPDDRHGAFDDRPATASRRSSSCWTTAATAPSAGCTAATTPSTTFSAWRYARLPEVLGGGKGYEVATEGQFDSALRQALADRSGFSLIHVHLGRRTRALRWSGWRTS